MINSITNAQNWFTQFNQISDTNQTAASAPSGYADGPAQGGPFAASEAHGPRPRGMMFEAIAQAFSQIGVGTDATSATSGTTSASTTADSTSSTATADSTSSQTTATASSSSSQNPMQALASFMQNLMAALHAQGTQGSDSDGDNDGSGTKASGFHHHHRHHLQADLQSLIQELSSTGSDSTTSTSSTTSASDATASASDSSASSSASSSSDPTLSALQQSFQNLVTALGGGGSNATLSSFLQAFAGNMSNPAATGNIIAAQA